VLEVHGSSDPDAGVRCTLKDEDLASSPGYEAISYAWEAQLPSQYIICDGLEMLVTENCAAILRHFRPKSSDGSRRIWIDAICIDQGSVLEKNHQLKLMGDVYRNATCVLVWLVPANVNDDTALYLFDQLDRLANLAAGEPDESVRHLVTACREILEASKCGGGRSRRPQALVEPPSST
jgi:hypothetical protein